MIADQTLQDVSSRLAIQHALSLYCRGIDRLDAQLIAAAYWPDAAEDHGSFKGIARDFAPWIVKFLDENYVATQHILGQSCIEVRGEHAGGETYVSSLHHCRKGGGRVFEAVNGRYVDRFERRNGAWKISSRVVVLDFLREVGTVPAGSQRIPGLALGARGSAA